MRVRIATLASTLALCVACTPGGGGGVGDGGTPGGDGGSPATCDQACRDQAKPDHCVSTHDYFAARAFPRVLQRCTACHVSGGAAAATRFVMQDPSLPGAVDANLAAFSLAAALELDGRPLVELKPTMTVAHGGGRVIETGSFEHATILEAIDLVRTPVTCPDGPPVDPDAYWNGITLLDAKGTLRKATLDLAGRLPTDAERAAVASGGLDALDDIVTAQLQEKGFHARVREFFNDVLLTDAFRDENGDAPLVSNFEVREADFPNATTFQSPALYAGCEPGSSGCPTPSHKTLVNTGDALGREPTEFVVYAVKNDLPLTTIVTSRYRLVNAYSAHLFGLGWDGHALGDYDPEATDPDDFRPARIPGINENKAGATYEYSEYAGILTTPAWRRRYPNTCTNNNRKIARHTYRAFLDFDIMKNAARLDLSSIDLSMHPSRTNAQCTGCHVAIDPVAGAYMNWTPCSMSPARYYTVPERAGCGSEGWKGNDEMFPPGVGPGEANVLSRELWTHGLEALGDYIAAQPGFATAMVRHFYTGIIGRPPLEAPPDPTADGFLAAETAYEAQKAEFDAFVAAFKAGGMKVAPLVRAIVKSRTYRAANADADGHPEWIGLGGGTWLPPELLHRRITAVFGAGWDELFQDAHGGKTNDAAKGYGHLTRRDRERIFAGGIDSQVVKTRQRLPSGLASAVVDRMAYEMSCLHVARDFGRPTASRLLFPGIELTTTPVADASDASQAPVLAALVRLAERFWGLETTTDDPEIRALHALLVAAHAASVSSGDTRLPNVCTGNFDLRSGVKTNGQAPSGAAVHVVRAWQAVIVMLATDDRFLSE